MMTVGQVKGRQKLKYPKSIFFIISNEFCERFSYYGMRTVLTLYLRNQLLYTNDSATVVYHVFTMFVYFFPIFGAILADSWLGKFRTIFYLSIVYTIGQILMALSAAPVIGLPPSEFTMLGLILIALGTGGIKPCVAAFGGDQFILPQQERQLSMFFSLFYFSINSGSFISSFLTPLLRTSVSCFGLSSCYSLAFLVPAILMAVSIVIFLVGRPMYRVANPTGNVMLNVSKCISRAICNKVKSKGTKREHWLDYADDRYDHKLISDVKAVLQVLKLFIPLPVFWALFDQQGSRWTLQATKMSGELGTYLIEPDQMQVVNPLLVLVFIPFFEACVYPVLAKIHINTPLRKLTVGGLVAALSFVVSAIIELKLETTLPMLPSSGLAQVRIFNTMNCPIDMRVGEEEFRLQTMSWWSKLDVPASGNVTLEYEADFTACQKAGFTSLNGKVKNTFVAAENDALSLAMTPKGLSYHYQDAIDKSLTGNPTVRGLVYLDPSLNNAMLDFLKDGNLVMSLELNATTFANTDLQELRPATYDIRMNDKIVQRNVELKLGGVYTVVGFDLPGTTQKQAVHTITVTQPNSFHVLWQVPQYVIITAAEVMFSVTGLEFAFTQAPGSMKSVLQAFWLLTVAVGNIIVVIVAEASIFSSQAYEFFLFAGLMVVDMVIFAIMASFYRYVEKPTHDTFADDTGVELKNGNINASYKDDEK